jgi:hypothetical protein
VRTVEPVLSMVWRAGLHADGAERHRSHGLRDGQRVALDSCFLDVSSSELRECDCSLTLHMSGARHVPR